MQITVVKTGSCNCATSRVASCFTALATPWSEPRWAQPSLGVAHPRWLRTSRSPATMPRLWHAGTWSSPRQEELARVSAPLLDPGR